MNGFTKGEFRAIYDEKWGCAGILNADGSDWGQWVRSPEEDMADAELIAAALTSATKLAEAGYDAQAVMEALPEIVGQLGDVASWVGGMCACRGDDEYHAKLTALLARIRPEASLDRADQAEREGLRRMAQRAFSCHLRGGLEAQTFFAATASKARYMALLEWSDCIPGLSFRDITVSSLGMIETPQEIAERQAAEWNTAHGPGTPIRVYPLLNGDEATGYDTVACEPGAYVLGGNRVSVKVPGDCIALTHVRVRASAQGGGGR